MAGDAGMSAASRSPFQEELELKHGHVPHEGPA